MKAKYIVATQIIKKVEFLKEIVYEKKIRLKFYCQVLKTLKLKTKD